MIDLVLIWLGSYADVSMADHNAGYIGHAAPGLVIVMVLISIVLSVLVFVVSHVIAIIRLVVLSRRYRGF